MARAFAIGARRLLVVRFLSGCEPRPCANRFHEDMT